MQKLLIEHIRRVYHGFESVAHHHIIHLLTGEAMGTGLWEGQLPPPNPTYSHLWSYVSLVTNVTIEPGKASL